MHMTNEQVESTLREMLQTKTISEIFALFSHFDPETRAWLYSELMQRCQTPTTALDSPAQG